MSPGISASAWPPLAALLFIWAMIALTFIDLDTFYLPDDITLPLLWAGLLFNHRQRLTSICQSAVIGAVAGYLSLWSVYWVFKLATGKEGMGYGDFKLLAAIGAWLGWQMLPLVDSAVLAGRRGDRHRPDRLCAARPQRADPVRPLSRHRRHDRAASWADADRRALPQACSEPMPFCVGAHRRHRQRQIAAPQRFFGELGAGGRRHRRYFARTDRPPAAPRCREIAASSAPDYIAADGASTAPRMRELVFADPAGAKKLEAILHPLIRASRRATAVAEARQPYVCWWCRCCSKPAPIATWCSACWSSTARRRLQIARTMQRSGS